MDAMSEVSYNRRGMDNVRKLIRDKVVELDLTLAQVSRQIGRNSGYLYDFLEKGSPRALPESERQLLSAKLGISEDYLRNAPGNGTGVIMPRAEGERIDVSAFRDTRLREILQRELKAIKRGELWLLNTPLIEAKYAPGTLVVVDVGATAYENDYVMAEVWSGKEKTTIFRKYIPPNIVAAVVNTPSVRGHTVDRESVVIRGVIRVGLR